MDRGQMIFFGAAALFLLYETIRGWRLGIVRQLVRLLALASAYLAAVFLGGYLVPILRLTGYPDLVLQPAAMAIAGIAAYFVISFVGRVLFRKTTDQDIGAVWFLYGVSGALLGVVFGLVLVTAMAVAIRFLGTLADGITRQPGGTDRAPAAKKATVAGLVELKHSLEAGKTGEFLQTVDPIPKKAYEIIEKIGRVSASPEAIRRFLDYPGAQELTQRPEIASLRDDPEVVLALREGRYLALLKNSRISKAANDPKVKELVGRFNLEGALDYALEAPQHEGAPPAGPAKGGGGDGDPGGGKGRES